MNLPQIARMSFLRLSYRAKPVQNVFFSDLTLKAIDLSLRVTIFGKYFTL
ncbi:hypothetical protein FHS11_001204 [Mucilaginibacter gotjawali]|uniref:Uncharacterized protein n=1 Tax=Mucilaginibacter gotjawali TaxID=1550579 RepID=A0A839SBU0_9SPHI|nr:hypothetical protein [Mucilaginibacter gotjawali]